MSRPHEEKKNRTQAWADFVWELRRHGYWGDPEKYREFFKGFFESYFSGTDGESYQGYLEHCCDSISDEGFDGPWWKTWTKADEEKVRKECESLSQKEEREKFWALKRAFQAYKQGKYTEENLLHFFAGFCGYAPTSEEDLKIKEEN